MENEWIEINDWVIKEGGPYGPGPNLWKPVSSIEYPIRLEITKQTDLYYCSELSTESTYGHGIYEWTFKGLNLEWDPNIVLGLFLYKIQPEGEDRINNNMGEIDIEFAKWQNPDNIDIGQFTIPPNTADLMNRFCFITSTEDL